MNKLHPINRFANLFACILATFAIAAHAEFYEVEMTVFTNDNPRYIQEQNWPKNIHVDYPSKISSLSTQAPEVIYPELVQPNRPSAKPYLVPLLDTQFNRHNDAVRKLEQSGEHRVLFHQTWLQKMEPEAFAPNIIIQAGNITNNVYELGGTISLYQTTSPEFQGVTLRIKSRLWRVDFGTDNNTGNNTAWPVPVSFSISDNGITPLPAETAPPIKRIAVLNAAEIIRRDTLHYLDNPLFGVLLEIRPYSAIQLRE